MARTTRRGAGEGAIFRRKDRRWCGILSLGREGGKRIRKSFYGATAEALREQMLEARSDRSAGLPVLRGRLTLGQFLERWLMEFAKPAVRPRTLERYQQLVGLHVMPEVGQSSPREIAAADVQRLLNRKLADGLSPKTVRHVRAVLTVALNRSLRWGLLSRNVAALTDAPKLARHEIQPLTLTQTRQFSKRRGTISSSSSLCSRLQLGRGVASCSQPTGATSI